MLLSGLFRALPVAVGGRTSMSLRALSSSGSGNDIAERIGGLIQKEDVVVFMKGVPAQPQCGFSNAVVQILRMHDVKFEGHNVLEDEELRQGK